MQVHEVDVRLLSLPLIRPFTTAAGTTDDREVVVVRLATSVGEGWGECAALTAPTYTEEYARGAYEVLHRHLAPRLAGAVVGGAADALRLLAPVVGHPMARAALELAILDAATRADGSSLAAHLGGCRARVVAGVAVGIAPDVPALLREVEHHLAAGYRRVKCKIRPGWDVEPLAAVRALAGPDVALVADANGAYGRDDVEHLARLDDLGLLALEQPLAADDVAGHVGLAERLRTPVCLDESVRSAPSAAVLLDAGACRVVSVKASRLGGLGEALATRDACTARGAGAWVGGMLETGIGRAAALALASVPGVDLPADLSASDRYYVHDVTEPSRLGDDGCLAVPAGPGLGVTVDLDVVEACTVARTRVPADGPPAAG